MPPLGVSGRPPLTDELTQFHPRRRIPIAAGTPGRGRDDEERRAEKSFRLPAVIDLSPAEEVLASVLAVERHRGGPEALDLRDEFGNIETVFRQLVIASPFRLA